MPTCEVKFGRLGGRIEEIAVEDGTTIEDGMKTAGFTDYNPEKESVTVKNSTDHEEGSNVAITEAVEDQATYLIVPGTDNA